MYFMGTYLYFLFTFSFLSFFYVPLSFPPPSLYLSLPLWHALLLHLHWTVSACSICFELFGDMDMMLTESNWRWHYGDTLCAFSSLGSGEELLNGSYSAALTVHIRMQDLSHLSHLLNAVGEDVSDDNPLLGRRPQVHLDQDNVVKQHQVAHVCHLR